jgi:hypothetical protein
MTVGTHFTETPEFPSKILHGIGSIPISRGGSDFPDCICGCAESQATCMTLAVRSILQQGFREV